MPSSTGSRPGVYNFDTSSRIVTTPYVDIEGSGRGVTKIYGNQSAIEPMIDLADHSSIRDLNVELNGGPNSIAIAFSDTVSNVDVNSYSGCYSTVGLIVKPESAAMIDNATVFAHNGRCSSNEIGIYVDASSSATIRNSTINAGTTDSACLGSRHGVWGGPLKLENVTINVPVEVNPPTYSFGLNNVRGGQATNLTVNTGGDAVNTVTSFSIRQSVLKGDTGAVRCGDGVVLNIANTQIVGPVISTGNVNCFGTYDDAYQPVNCLL